MRWLFPLLLLIPCLLAQEPAAPANQESVQKEVGLEQMFRTPPGQFLLLKARPIDTIKVNGSEKARYALSAPGLPTGKTYLLMAWELGASAPHILLPRVQADRDGVLRCGAKSKDCPGGPGAEIDVAVSKAPGQPSHFVLAAEDQQPLALGELLPTPAVAKSGACSVEAVLLRPDAEIVWLVGRGFAPAEEITFTSHSGTDDVRTPARTNPDGEFNTALVSTDKSKSGTATVHVHGSKCELDITFASGASDSSPTPAEAAPAAPAQSPTT